MATCCCRSTRVTNNDKTDDYNIDLFPRRNNKDWTQAIHQDLNIKRRTCTTFVPKDKKTLTPGRSRDNVQCCCNRLRREHSWNPFDDDNAKWDRKTHTVSAYNNAYGYIPQTRAHYIRCDIETQPRILAQLMFDVWAVKKPQLIMCIIGGAKYFKLSERLEREFMKGIIQAALKADGWIVTSGFKTGVVQLIGEAIHDHRVTNPRSHITAIGCSKWGATKNRDALISSKASANLIDDSSKTPSKNEKKSEQELEPNHTHFLLLDDGTYYGYDIGNYRTQFVLEASRYQKQTATDNQQQQQQDVPVVTIVVEGGPDTLSTIYNDLRKDIPVVLIDGSGRVPNLLANFLTRTETMINRSGKEESDNWKNIVDIENPNDIEKLKTKFHAYTDEIRDGLKDISKGSKKDENSDSLFYCFLYCLQPAVRSKIRVYSLDSDHHLDDTIFEAIIQGKQQKNSDKDQAATRKQLLLLALAWDAFAVAKEHIIKNDLNDLDNPTKKELFLEALKRDRAQFIDTFIKLNFDVAKMFYAEQTNVPWKLDWDKLADLYNKDYLKNKERLYLLKKCHGSDQINSQKELDHILNELIGDYMKPAYTSPPSGFFDRLRLCCRRSQRDQVSNSRIYLYAENDDDDASEIPNPEETQQEARELVLRDLFFWSILTNRIEMSKVILNHMQSRICGALIASKVLKSYIKYARDNDSKEVLRLQADEFEEYAINCLKCCYNFDEEKACEIAIRRIHLFGGVSCLQIAVDADNKNFVGQPCCDQLLTNTWYDKIEPYQSTTIQRLKILLCTCTLGLLAPFFVSFRQVESDPSLEDFHVNQKPKYGMTVNETEDETKELIPKRKKRLNKYGINYSDVNMERSNGCSRYFRHLKQFHESPYIKYLYNAASYIFFLLLFSYYLLFNFNIPTDDIPSIHWTEILVIIIVSTMFIEDVRQFLCQENRSLVGKLQSYFINDLFFSSIRVTSYFLFYIGLILRFTNVSSDADFSAAKIVLAYDLELWFIRSLKFVGIAQKLGPKLVMIRKMIVDLFFFIYIILIAMIAYGVVSRSMYDYNSDANTDDLIFDGRSIFRHIIYPSYYLMYGSTDSELAALDNNPDMPTAIATQVLLAFQMLFVNILLINLLIAMFSYTFQTVQDQADLVWRYERYLLIREYFDRPALFPPLIIITHFIELIKLIIRHIPRKNRSKMNRRRAKTFKMIGNNREIDRDWSEFESYATNLYARGVVTGQPSSAAALVPSKARQEAPLSTAESFNIPQMPLNFDVKTLTDEMSSIKRVIGDLRTYAEEMNRSMQWMMDAMERVKMSKEPKPRLRSAITTNDIKQTDEGAFL